MVVCELERGAISVRQGFGFPLAAIAEDRPNRVYDVPGDKIKSGCDARFT